LSQTHQKIDTVMGPDESVEPMRASAGLPLLGQVSVFRAERAEKRAWKFQRFAAWLRKAGYVSTFHGDVAAVRDRRADIHEAFLRLGCCLICWRRLANPVLRGRLYPVGATPECSQ
jgi:hypothetical protein